MPLSEEGRIYYEEKRQAKLEEDFIIGVKLFIFTIVVINIVLIVLLSVKMV